MEFWCELVAAGIGGRTIAEAKQALTMHEAKVWRLYREKNGTLNSNYLLDRGFALLAHLVSVGHQIKVGKEIPSVESLMMQPKVEESVCVDVNQVFGFLKGLKKNGK